MNFILWLQNAIHLNLSFQQTQNGGIHTRTDVSQMHGNPRDDCAV